MKKLTIETSSEDFIKDISKEINSKVKTDKITRLCYRTDVGKSVTGIPSAVITPTSTDETSIVMKLANKHCIPITLKGGGTTIGGETVTNDSVLMDIKHLKGVINIDKRRKLVNVLSGTTWLELYDSLSKEGLTFKVAPSSATCTVGGTVAVGGFNPNSFKYGSSADQVKEIEVVLPSGDIKICNQKSNPEIFNNSLYGNGMIGVITKVKMEVKDSFESTTDYWFGYTKREYALNDLFKLCENDVGDGIMFIEACGIPIIRIETENRELDEKKVNGKLINIFRRRHHFVSHAGWIYKRFIYSRRWMISNVHSFPFSLFYKPTSRNHFDLIFPNKNDIHVFFNYTESLWKNVKSNDRTFLAFGGKVTIDSINERPFSPYPSSIKKGALIFGAYTGATHPTEYYKEYQMKFTEKSLEMAIERGGILYKYCGHVRGFAKKMFDEERWEHLKRIKRKYDPNNILNRGALFD